MRHLAIVIAVATLWGAVPLFAGAQGFTGAGGALGVSINFNPPNPGPNQTVTANIQSIGIDTARSLIAWRVNGRDATRGVGVATLVFQTGPLGSVTTIEVAAEGPGGIPVGSRREVRPAAVAIIWEADTYTPPFFDGKALVTPGAKYRLIAVPELIDAQGKKLSASELMYKWERNNRPVPAASGFGKYYVELENDTFIRPLSFTVTVSTLDESIIAQGTINVPIGQTRLVAVEDHPLLGVRFLNPIGSRYALSRDEATIVIEPYYYSIPNRSSSLLEYQWRVGGGAPPARDTIVFRRTGASAGESKTELLVTHRTQLLQTNRMPLSILFGERSADDSFASQPGATEQPPAF